MSADYVYVPPVMCALITFHYSENSRQLAVYSPKAVHLAQICRQKWTRKDMFKEQMEWRNKFLEKMQVQWQYRKECRECKQSNKRISFHP